MAPNTAAMESFNKSLLVNHHDIKPPPPAASAPPKELSQARTVPPIASLAAPGACHVPPIASLAAPGAYSAPMKKSPPASDPGMQPKEREKQLRKEALSQRNSMTGARNTQRSLIAEAAKSASTKSLQGSDPGMEAKEREKQLRKEALSQRNLMAGPRKRQSNLMAAAAKSPPPPPPMKSPPDSDPGMEAKEREKQLRKEALSQRNLMAGARNSQHSLASKSPPPPSAKKSPPASDPGIQAKEREKQLRKEALSQRNLVAGARNSQRNLLAAASKSPSTKSLQSLDPGMEAKGKEKQLRKEALSQRNLMAGARNSQRNLVAAATNPPPPPSPKKSPPASDSGMDAKQREKQLRKESLSQRSLMAGAGNSQHSLSAAAASPLPPNLNSPKKSPSVSGSGMDAKEREKQLRKEALSQRNLVAAADKPQSPPSPVKSLQVHPSTTTSPLAGKPSQMDQDIAAKLEAVSPMAYPAASDAYSAPSTDLLAAPGAGSDPDSEMRAKEREQQLRKEALGQGDPTKSSLSAKLSQMDEDIAAKLEAVPPMVCPAAPGAYATPGAHSAPPGELSQMDQRITAKQGVAPLSASLAAAALQPKEQESQVARTEMQNNGPQYQDAEYVRDRIAPIVPPPLEWGIASQNEAEQDLEAPPCWPEQAPQQEDRNAAPSYRLTQQPQQQEQYISPSPEEETVALTSNQLAGVFSADSGESGESGLNLVEATLVVEEMVEATVATPMEFHEDEVMKIREQSAEETARIKMWRIIVSLALVATAVAVTTSTYMLLVEREDQNFRNVYYQFATTVADAAVEQQANIRDSLFSFADTVATMAEAAGNGSSPWPYFVVPRFETLGKGFKSTSNAEFIAIQNFVTHDQRDSYIDFITPRYQDFVKEAHMEAYGHLDHLNNDTSNYQPFIAQKLPNKTFVPDIEREFYFTRTTQSPPARKYGPTINNNLIANKVIGDGFAAVMAMHNESVFTPIKPFANVPADEHAKMHSNGAEGANNPHSFTFHPVHREAGNQSSDIVAMFACATAWDFSMLNLLPDNVKGMYCLVENTCNQTVTYRIDGGNATYLGEGELQPTQYDDMAVFVDLSLQAHPKARTTPGHCMYSMRIYPSKDFEDDYKTSTPGIYAGVVAGTFVLIAVVLFIYDLTVTKRNEKMIYQAAKTNAILSKFVPDHLRDRIMGFERQGPDSGSQQELDMSIMDRSKLVQNYMDKSMHASKMDASLGVGSHARSHTRRRSYLT